jgi:hypothetical protein
MTEPLGLGIAEPSVRARWPFASSTSDSQPFADDASLMGP